MNLTATSESSAQSIASWRVYNGNYWWELRLVGWIAQNTNSATTNIYFKWQVGSLNYWPYQNDNHTYTVQIGESVVTTSFALKQDRSNLYKDKSSPQSILVAHDSNGNYSGTIKMRGYKCWENFESSETITLPSLTPVTPDPQDPTAPIPIEPDNPQAPIINDLDPRFYIFADGEIIYSNNDEDYQMINPKLTLELNQTDSLDFTIPPGHAMYNSLAKLKTTVEVKQGMETLFRGRVLSDEIDFFNQKNVHCEGALAFLGDTIMPPYAAGTYTTAKDLFKAAMQQHEGLVPNSTPKRKIKYVTCNVSSAIDFENDEYSTTSEVVNKLLSDIGGYLKLEYYDNGDTGLSYLSAIDHTSSQAIVFGDNLLDLTQSIDASGVYTSVVCLGKKDEETGVRLTTGSGNAMYVESQDAISIFGRIIRVFTYDEIENQNDLRATANLLLLLGVQQSITFTIKAVDLHLIYPNVEKIRVGDTIEVISRPHNVDAFFQCSMIDLDMQNPNNTVYTFGSTPVALTNTTSKK